MRRQRRWATTGVAFREKLAEASRRNNSLLCVGIDPDPARLAGTPVAAFVGAIIEATRDIVCAYKPNLAFFEALGIGGMQTLLESLRSVPAYVPIIADAKRGDIASTARFYARALFDVYDFDAATVNAYGGRDAVEPFLEYEERGILVWCRSSNPGAAEVQDLELADGRRLYEAVAELANGWNVRGNVGLVMGATWPEQLERVRAVCPDMPLLLPGVGSQGADVGAMMRAGLTAEGSGIIVNASRQVLYASAGDGFAEAARREALSLRDELNRQRDALLAAR
jgi:orotidine-5'-phosphate decarboxylase